MRLPTEIKRVVIIGAGPAGLTAGYELCKAGAGALVLEKSDAVGGLARTVNHEGYRFDIGGHRFYTKVAAVDELWREVLPRGDFLRRKRLSRIYHRRKFFHYPLRASSMLFGLGPWEGLLILSSYLRARLSPSRPEVTFEHWVTNRFGRRLYESFFKSYTEKVWGMPCDEISAEWASQRIRGLSLTVVLKKLLTGREGGDEVVKTLIDEFDYPARGPGMMWETMAELLKKKGGEVRLRAGVEKIHWRGSRVEAVEVSGGAAPALVRGTDFISSMPLGELVERLEPRPPAEVAAAARKLRYRDFLTVALVVNRGEVFPDNWIYIHDSRVRLGRVQNFKNWSEQMVPDQSKTCLGLEYFCSEGDDLWSRSDDELLELGRREVETLGLVRPGEVEGGTVVRVRKAYPVYDSAYREALLVLRRFLEGFENFHTVGRNGMHRYNNQDHSMLTAMRAVENILHGAGHDLWEVNADQEYHEDMREGSGAARATERLAPERVGTAVRAAARARAGESEA